MIGHVFAHGPATRTEILADTLGHRAAPSVIETAWTYPDSVLPRHPSPLQRGAPEHGVPVASSNTSPKSHSSRNDLHTTPHLPPFTGNFVANSSVRTFTYSRCIVGICTGGTET